MPKETPKDEPTSTPSPYSPATPAADAPAAKTPAVKTPAAKTPAAKASAAKTPTAKTPAAKTPAAATPAAATPAAATPAAATPAANLPPAPAQQVVPPVLPPVVAQPLPPAAGVVTPAPYSNGGPTPPYSVGGPPPAYLMAPQTSQTTLSLLAMIFGIIGLVLSCCYGAGVLFGAAGIVLGHLGRKRENAQGMALAGLITGYASVALSILMWVLLFALALSPLLLLPFMATTSGY